MKCVLLLLLFIYGCNSSEPTLSPISGVRSPSSHVALNLKLTNLGSDSIIVTLNGESSLVLTQDGTYPFEKKVAPGLDYEVHIKKQPSDRNCVVKNPFGFAQINNSIEVTCAPTLNYFVGGEISGLDTGPLTITHGGETITVPAGAKSYFFPNPFGLTSTITLTPPSDKECFFLATQSTSYFISASDTAFDTPIYCQKKTSNTYTVTLNFTGLSGTATVSGRSKTNFQFSNFSTSANFMTSSLYENTRNIFEITAMPTGQRCYFNDTKTSFYTENIPAQDHVINITCVARTNCDTTGMELPSVDGIINDVTCLDDRIVYGGDFRRVGKQRGIAHITTDGGGTDSGSLTNTFHDRIHGTVRVIVPDGRGGYFIGGNFKRVSDKGVSNLVRVNNRLVIDESFNWETDGEVLALEVSHNKLYVFGNFSNVKRGNTFFPRKSFAKIDLLETPGTLTDLTLPKDLFLNSVSNLSVKLIESEFFIHGNYILNGVAKNLFLKFNKNSGSLFVKETGATEIGNTLFWKEPLSGKVWMLTQALGMVNPIDLSPHPQATPLNLQNKHFTLLPDSRLFVSDTSDVQVVDLKNLYAGATVDFFAKDPTGTVGNVVGAGAGFNLTNDIVCFTQAAPYIPITLNGYTRKGIACFTLFNERLAPLELPSTLKVRSHFVKTQPSTYDIFLGIQHFESQVTQSLALIGNGNALPIAYNSNLAVGDVINSLDQDGNFVYVGGKFSNFGCASCNNLSRMNVSSGTTDVSWVLTVPLDDEVTQVSVDGSYLFAATKDSSRKFFGMDLLDTLDSHVNIPVTETPSKVVNLVNSVSYIEDGSLKFRDILPPSYSSVLNSYPLVSGTSLNRTFTRFITSFSSNTLEFYDLDGSLDYTISGYSLDPLKSQVATIGNYSCLLYQSTDLRCFTTIGVLNLKRNLPLSDYRLFKGMRSYLIVHAKGEAPLTFANNP